LIVDVSDIVFPEFRPFNKIPRLNRGMVVTEKIDGTNGIVHIADDGRVFAGSRNRWLTVEKDNFGFAAWVEAHKDELSDGLGVGTHYGEWWGSGIQRRYGLEEKRFSLFNASRWNEENPPPDCCHVVPIIRTCNFSSEDVADCVALLRDGGSLAAPGFMDPEGVVVYLSAARQMFKVTLVGDESPKGLVGSSAEA
jgi:hypothetical protein